MPEVFTEEEILLSERRARALSFLWTEANEFDFRCVTVMKRFSRNTAV